MAAGAGAPLSPRRKAKVLARHRGVGDVERVERALGVLVRDAHLSARRGEVHAVHGGHGYSLRPWPGAAGAAVLAGQLAVDHTWECQLVAHAIVRTPAFGAGGGGSILGSVDVGAPRTRQAAVVQAVLDPVFRIQNCVGDATLFNLRLMPQALNSTKGHVFTDWVATRRAGGGDAGAGDLGALLERGFRRSAAAERAELDAADAEDLARGIVVAIRGAAEGYSGRLTDAASAVGDRGVRACFEGLAETLADVMCELGLDA